jgi:hypothetical protein
LCKMLVGRSEFAGPDFSWGDRVIHHTANSSSRPAGEPTWRGAATSHHLRLVVDAMAGLELTPR